MTDLNKRFAIFMMAQLLLAEANSTTTNKEIKDALHLIFPGIELRQKEVSECMNFIYKTAPGTLHRELHPSGEYFVYSIEEEMQKQNEKIREQLFADMDLSFDSDPLGFSNEIKSPSYASGSDVSTNNLGNSTAIEIIGNVNDLKDKIHSFDLTLRVAYSQGKSDFHLINTTDRYEARRLFKQVAPTKHNDIRNLSLKNFIKYHLDSSYNSNK